jgi:hypothetical protein
MTPALLKRSACQLEILALRSLELADRAAAGEIVFLDSVDIAYDAAVWSGLIETVGDDIVQATLAAAFANLIVKADRSEPLVVLPFRLAVEIAKAAKK